MRTASWSLGVLLVLGLALPAWAQRSATQIFSGGFNPQQIVNQPIDTSRALAPASFPSAVPQQQSFFSRFASLIPRLRLSTPVHPQGALPRSPSTPSATVLPNAFQPQLPFMPQQ